MNLILSEKEYQRAIIDYLVNENDYIERKPKTDFDRYYVMDKELLFKFLADLRKLYKGNMEETVINFINKSLRAE